MVKVITFDLGNVLYRFNPMLAAQGLAKIAGLKLSPLQILHFFQTSEEEKKYCEGKISTQEFYEYVIRELKVDCTFDDFSEMFCNIFNELPESFAIVEELKSKGLSLMLLSNTNELHYGYLYRRHPILQSFNEVVLSYKVQCQKPDPKIYQILIKRANCSPEEILFIDDLKENIDGASQMGIQTHQFKSVSQLRKELVKRELLN